MSDLDIYRKEHPPREGEGVYEISIEVTASGRNKDSGPLLFAECITRQEWESQIDALITRLNDLRKQGLEYLPD